jgi:hypothetical protein
MSALKATFLPEEVLSRVGLLKRIVRDVVDSYERRRKAKELHQEFLTISRTIRSPEIEETINSLRSELKDLDRHLDAFDKEIRDLGGILKDARKGLVYFYSERDGRKIFLVWELYEPDLVSWHELDETFSDRIPLETRPLGTSASGSPSGGSREPGHENG